MKTDNISELLFKEANKSYINHKIACIITHRGEIISIGYNYSLSHNSSKSQCLLRT